MATAEATVHPPRGGVQVTHVIDTDGSRVVITLDPNTYGPDTFVSVVLDGIEYDLFQCDDDTDIDDDFPMSVEYDGLYGASDWLVEEAAAREDEFEREFGGDY